MQMVTSPGERRRCQVEPGCCGRLRRERPREATVRKVVDQAPRTRCGVGTVRDDGRSPHRVRGRAGGALTCEMMTSSAWASATTAFWCPRRAASGRRAVLARRQGGVFGVRRRRCGLDEESPHAARRVRTGIPPDVALAGAAAALAARTLVVARREARPGGERGGGGEAAQVTCRPLRCSLAERLPTPSSCLRVSDALMITIPADPASRRRPALRRA